MISVIHGAKGSGKTKRIIDAANTAAAEASGQVVMITDNDSSLAVDSGVRFVNLAEYNVKTQDEFIGFLKGMLATDFDIQKVFIDGLCRLLDKNAEDLKTVFTALESISDSTDFIATVSTDKLPDFMKAYAAKA